MTTYARLAVSFERGDGAWLIDGQGRRYLDALCGIGVTSLGHAHPAVAEAVCQQARTLIHSSNLYGITLQQQLANRLTALAGMERAFFCNSGAEAVEAGIKLARLHGHTQGYTLPTIIVAEHSFHGRTLATLSATGNRKVQAGFEPLVQGFLRVPYNDMAAIETVARNTSEVVAVLVEPVQGEGGINIPDNDYLPRLRALCDSKGWLLMLDEIQTGLCRTGRWFAHQHAGITPDVMLLAKALGNGVPIGACLAAGPAAAVFHPGNHGSTFGGNPLACRAALAVLDTMEQQQLAARATALGHQLRRGLRDRLAGHPAVREVRGLGLMIGIELTIACGDLTRRALQHGILCSLQAERVIRLLPPLTLSDDEAQLIIERIAALIDDCAAQPA
ncbi:MAG: aspartate aminotransferase family protein [Gammaproteobacteria bacterium]|nr:aspartate aminotransferase family protein [Gammaproteobacteria bacterium]